VIYVDASMTKEKVKNTGTTTVGIACKDGIILGADKRATMGYLIASKDIDKIHQIDDRIAMTIAGGVGDAQMLVRWMKAEIKLYELRQHKKITVEAAATLLSNILAQYKYFPFFVQLLVGGVDKKPHVFSVDMLGGVTEEHITSTGSGSPIAYGVLEELYVEDGTVEDNLKVAAKSVNAAIRRDAASGEAVDLIVITQSGFKRYSKEYVKEMLEKKKKKR